MIINDENEINKVTKILRNCNNILFITGAGISAESGLPTYRGLGGLYNDEITEDGISIEMALAGDTLRTQPEITWKYLSKIRRFLFRAYFIVWFISIKYFPCQYQS